MTSSYLNGFLVAHGICLPSSMIAYTCLVLFNLLLSVFLFFNNRGITHISLNLEIFSGSRILELYLD
jgi:hypothetical protein